MITVEIYTRPFCSYCAQAMTLLKRKKIHLQEIEAGGAAHLRAQMQERSMGGNTFPQIFIDGKHVGGCDELIALEQNGSLDTLLYPAQTDTKLKTP